jgi:anti-sigma B factor antagonist
LFGLAEECIRELLTFPARSNEIGYGAVPRSELTAHQWSPCELEYAPRVSLLGIAVESQQFGVVIRLSGEADLATIGELRDALDSQISGGVQQLTIDLSGLRFADSSSIRALTDAHLALKAQGGSLELAHPQPNVARILVLLGIDQVLTVRPQPDSGTAGARLQEG